MKSYRALTVAPLACGFLTVACGGPVAEKKTKEAEKIAAPIQAKFDAGVTWVFSKPAKLEFTKTEITIAQFKKCIEAGICAKKNYQSKEDTEYCNFGWPDRDDHPINCIDWYGAKDFCNGIGGRLPKKEEWYAEASNGGKYNWPWGKTPDVTCDYAIWRQESGADGCGKDSTWPVCSKTQGNSVSGLCDMCGNVWEWTETDIAAKNKVMHGGGWTSDLPDYLRTSYKGSSDMSLAINNVGFRCVRPSAQPAAAPKK